MYCDDYHDDGHLCYLTQCPPNSGHRFVRNWKLGYETYGDKTFQRYRLWEADRDWQKTLITQEDGSTSMTCWCNTTVAMDSDICDGNGLILVSPAPRQNAERTIR
jgi:hypothetical protein